MLLSGGPLPETVLSHLGGAGGGARQILKYLDSMSVARLGHVDKEFRDMQMAYKKTVMPEIATRPFKARFTFYIDVYQTIHKKSTQVLEKKFDIDWMVREKLQITNRGGKIGGTIKYLPEEEEYIREIITFSEEFATHIQDIKKTKLTVEMESLFNLPHLLVNEEGRIGVEFDAVFHYYISKFDYGKGLHTPNHERFLSQPESSEDSD